MGLALGSETIKKEARWISMTVNKSPNSDAVLMQIRSTIGYYDQQGVWQQVSEQVSDARADAFTYLMALTPNQIAGGNQGGDMHVGDVINNLLYGVIGGQIKLTAHLEVDLIDTAGVPLAGEVFVYDAKGSLVGSGLTGKALTLPLLIGATLTITAPGHEPISETIKLLQGDVVLKRSLGD